LVTVIADLWVTVGAHPDVVGPAAGILVVAGLIAVRRPALGAPAARVLELLEYAALAAAVPAACWVAGGFHL
jgi:hypothetical protein